MPSVSHQPRFVVPRSVTPVRPRARKMALLVCVGSLLTWLACSDVAHAQPPSARALDRKADELQAQFLKELDQLAYEYETAGLIDRARETLKKRQGIQANDAVAAKLEEFEQRDFELNQAEFTVRPEKGWMDTGLDVREGGDVRIEANGEVRIIMNQQVGPAGLKLDAEMNNVPIGALIAVVFPPREGKKKPEPSRPIVVGEKKQFSPPKSGRLFMRVATPTGADKTIGKYEVVVSGKITKAGGRR